MKIEKSGVEKKNYSAVLTLLLLLLKAEKL